MTSPATTASKFSFQPVILIPVVAMLFSLLLLPAPWNVSAAICIPLLLYPLVPSFKAMARQLFLSWRFFATLWLFAASFIAGYFYQPLFLLVQTLFVLFVMLTALDVVLVFSSFIRISAFRQAPRRLSNGDQNTVQLFIQSAGAISVIARIIDELPHQFQNRNFSVSARFLPGERKSIAYHLRPVSRGVYYFGNIQVFAATSLGFAERRVTCFAEAEVQVYPSFIQMRKYELLAFSSKLEQSGIKKIRRIGHSYEFDHIKEYTRGDDYRTINWKASARRARVMINHYEDEKAQPVYAVIDMGRTMKSPFAGMTLLEYAVNTALVLLNNAMNKGDRGGLIAFSEDIRSFVPAERGKGQLARLLESLYAQQTGFRESNFELLSGLVFNKIRQRSLLIIFTNFESSVSLERQLVHLKSLAVNHIPVVVFFRNAEIEAMAKVQASTPREVYDVVLAEDFIREKRVIAAELRKHGIASLLTTPESLTVDTLNKYLELKALGVL